MANKAKPIIFWRTEDRVGLVHVSVDGAKQKVYISEDAIKKGKPKPIQRGTIVKFVIEDIVKKPDGYWLLKAWI